MIVKLRTKMAATHGMIAVLTIFLVVIVTYVLINEQFMDYVSENKSEEQLRLVRLVEEKNKNGSWNLSSLNEVGLEALRRGYFIKVKDSKGGVVWEPQIVDQKAYEQTLREEENKLFKHFGVFQPELQTKNYDIKREEKVYGTVEIGYFSNYFLTEHDVMFLDYLNTSLLWVAGISFLLSLALSTFISGKISSQLSNAVNVARDITDGNKPQPKALTDNYILEIRQLGEALEKLEENVKDKATSQKRLTADIAHELRTPLTTLQSHLEALIEGIWEPTHERLISCHEEILRMAALVKDLEQLNKYETAQIKLNKSTFDMAELIGNIYTNFQSDFIKKKIEFKFSGKNCNVYADRDKLGQVIVNLISNSLKYTRESGRVFINCRSDEKFLYIVINDNGIGISQADLPNVFNRLYRADASRTRSTGGAGIGLAIAKAIVEAHGGQIDLVSQVGLGTEFTVIIPTSLEQAQICN